MSHTGVRTFEIAVSISGPLDVPFEDWPANVQDAIFAALERKAEQVELPLKIVHAEYKTDPDVPPEHPGHHYLWVVASEIVVADARTLDPKRLFGPTH